MEDEDETADIGLIKISKPLNYSSSFYPICLPFDNPILPKDLSLIQWLYRDITKSNIEKLEIAILDSEECLAKYQKIESDKIIEFSKRNNQTLFCVDYNGKF